MLHEDKQIRLELYKFLSVETGKVLKTLNHIQSLNSDDLKKFKFLDLLRGASDFFNNKGKTTNDR